jgi:hypothetical protein
MDQEELTVAQTLKEVLRIFEFESNNIHVREHIAGKWESIALAKLPGFLAVAHVCRMLLNRLEQSGLTWMLEQPLESTAQKPAGAVDDDGGFGGHQRSTRLSPVSANLSLINVGLEYSGLEYQAIHPNMSVDEILAQVPPLVDELLKLRRALRILYTVPLVGSQEWGIKCISDHNSIIREVLDSTEDQILKRQQVDLEELRLAAKEVPLNEQLEHWIAHAAEERIYEPGGPRERRKP